MQYCRVGEYLSISRITGAVDNLLQIRLADAAPATVEVEVLPSIGPRKASLNPDEVLEAVRLGLIQVNAELGKSYWIDRIRFVANDSRPEDVYSFLTQALLRHLDAGQPFVVA